MIPRLELGLCGGVFRARVWWRPSKWVWFVGDC